ncbi:MAG: hypothetical protein IJ736_10455 [Firmicutes bacterium]|nr:hypothetical protein [Bacillota bacterium]
MNQYEETMALIEYYKALQRIKACNQCENRELEYELRTTRTKLEILGVNMESLEY